MRRKIDLETHSNRIMRVISLRYGTDFNMRQIIIKMVSDIPAKIGEFEFEAGLIF